MAYPFTTALIYRWSISDGDRYGRQTQLGLGRKQKQIDYPFHVRPTDGVPLLSRLGKLERLAGECGDHAHWQLRLVVDLEPQDWIVWGFKNHDHKLALEAGAMPIMAATPVMPEGVPLPNGLANPDRDFSGLARRMARKGFDDRR